MPVIAQTTSEVVTPRTSGSDSLALILPPAPPSLRPEAISTVPIGATSPLLPTAEEPINMDELFGSHEGFSFRTAAGVTLQPHRRTRSRLAVLVEV